MSKFISANLRIRFRIRNTLKAVLTVSALNVLLIIPAVGQTLKPNIGINLANIASHSPQWMFVDVMKQSAEWMVQDTDGVQWSIDNVDIPQQPNGYPVQVPFSDGANSYRVHSLLLFRLQYGYPAGEYTLIFDGTGEIILEWDIEATFSAGTVIHKFQITTPSLDGIHIIISKSSASDPVRNIRVIMPGFADTYMSQPFHPKFLELLDQFPVLRFMKPQEIEYNFISRWEDRITKDYYSQYRLNTGGLAMEYVAQLGRTLGTDPWISVPERADDNYITRMATILHDSLVTDQKIYIEYSNETWNPTYTVWHYAALEGAKLGYGPDSSSMALKYTAKRAADVFRIFNSVFGADSTQLVHVLATHGHNIASGNTLIAAFNNTAINPSNIKADVLAVAPYFSGEIFQTLIGEGRMDTISVEEVLDSMRVASKRDLDLILSDYIPLAAANNLLLIAYEGGEGMQPFGDEANNASVTRIMHEANRHPEMESIYLEHYAQWFDGGGGMYVTMDFVDQYDNFNAYGNLEYLDQDPATAPKWLAMFEAITSAETESFLPSGFSLRQNYPNPFNPTTTIEFSIPRSENVSIDIYNLLGQKVTRLIDKVMVSGVHTANWDASNVSSGIYFYRLQAGDFVQTRKMLLLK